MENMIAALYVWFYLTLLANVLVVKFASESFKRKVGVWLILNLAVVGTLMGVHLFTQTS
jgi:multidrug efflux pump subunit AcrB